MSGALHAQAEFHTQAAHRNLKQLLKDPADWTTGEEPAARGVGLLSHYIGPRRVKRWKEPDQASK